MIFKRIAAWIAYEIREEKITLSSQDAKRILMDVAPPVSPDVFSENRSREIRYDLTIIVPIYNSENWLERNVWSRSSCKNKIFLSDNCN